MCGDHWRVDSRIAVAGVPTESEHCVRVRCLLGYALKHVPVLDDLLSWIELKDDDARPIPIVGPVPVPVQDHEITVREHASEFDSSCCCPK
jgi:hypothetical protein